MIRFGEEVSGLIFGYFRLAVLDKPGAGLPDEGSVTPGETAFLRATPGYTGLNCPYICGYIR